jgi:hypothetical protein
MLKQVQHDDLAQVFLRPQWCWGRNDRLRMKAAKASRVDCAGERR